MHTEENAYQQLVEEIIRRMSKGTLHQGDLLPPISALAKELSLRKRDVKRAIRNLKTMGILEAREKDRIYLVGNITDSLCESMHVMLMLKNISPYEICQMRRAMELTAFPLAFERKEKLDLEELKTLLDQIHLGTVLESVQADEQSHMWLINASGNHLMECVMRSIWGICSTQMNLLLSDGMEDLRQRQKSSHEKLYKSFILNDMEMGLEAIHAHYLAIEEALDHIAQKELSYR